MPEAPLGTISFLFTDIVGSTRLWEKYPLEMRGKLARHDDLIRSAVERNGGYVFKTVGDSFCVAFETPQQALRGAIDAQKALLAEDWSAIGELLVRMGVHTGMAEFRDGDYFGGTLNRVSRVEAAAHGGQILLSHVSVELLEDEGAANVSFKPLGSHRLRNLDRPEHLFQVVTDGLPDSFPPPKSLEVLPNNLPVQATSFVGREREMEEIQRTMRRGPLLTLTGTGGTGKTRTALEVGARQINNFPDGVWLIELAPISDPERIPELMAEVLGVRDDPERTLRETVISFLRSKNILLIVDNCEHLLSHIAGILGEILRTAPRVKILATSRHSLGISGEMTFAIPPLGILDIRLQELTGPDIVQRLSQFDAVKLFIERATAVRSDFKVTNANAPAVAEICSRLDGIPLAIELAAARVRVLDVEQIAARLNDRFHLLRGGNRASLPHQQTLQALIDWSHDLLSEPERMLFRRMGAFVGGRTLEALEAVCTGDGIEEYDLLDLLEQLVDKSLIMVERHPILGSRYTMIESVWHYSREKLEASGEGDRMRGRHLEYFLHWAEQVGPRLEGPDQVQWLERVHGDFFNIRLAVRWAYDTGRTEEGLRLISTLYRLVEVRGNVAEALEMIEKLLAQPSEYVSPLRRAEALIAAGRMGWALDRYEESRKYYNKALAIFSDEGRESGVALAEMLLAFIERGDGHVDSAEQRFTRALDLARRHNLLYVQAGSQSGLGSIALDHGNIAEARRLKEESLAIYERLGDHWIIGLILWGIAQVALAQEDEERAASALRQWTKITGDLGNRWIQPYILDAYAQLSFFKEEFREAATQLGAAEALRDHFGAKFSAREQKEHEDFVARLKEKLSFPEFQAAWKAGREGSAAEILRRAAGQPA